jgi:Bacterial regulatory proteins, luxR family
VLELATRGLNDKEIAASLGISRRTVRDRFDEMRERTGTRTRAELIARAAEAAPPRPGWYGRHPAFPRPIPRQDRAGPKGRRSGTIPGNERFPAHHTGKARQCSRHILNVSLTTKR